MGTFTATEPGETDNEELEQRRQLIERIAASDLFRKSPRLRDLFLYVAECTLQNRLADVREQVIAERVFGRKPEFDGAQDSIVRAEARNLRKRLEAYFETVGKNEPVVVGMPKGGYALAFRQHSNSSPVEENRMDLLVARVVPNASVPAISTRQASYRTACLALGIVTVLFFALTLYLYFSSAILKNQLGIDKATLPFSALFNNDQDLLIVTSDTGMLQISYLLHRPVSLDEYIARTYPDVPGTNPPNLIRNWNLYEYTDGREMDVADLILRSNPRYLQHILLRSGHEVQLADFKEHNAVLIGSPISNPWAQLYEDKLNFRCEYSGGLIAFHNRVPRTREAAAYPTEDDTRHHRTFARVAFFPKTEDATATLLIAGNTAQATQAAGEFVTDRDRFNDVLQRMGIDPAGRPHFFEIMIRSDSFVGGAILPEVVAWRSKMAPEQ